MIRSGSHAIIPSQFRTVTSLRAISGEKARRHQRLSRHGPLGVFDPPARMALLMWINDLNCVFSLPVKASSALNQLRSASRVERHAHIADHP
jgi:hypothetical protein